MKYSIFVCEMRFVAKSLCIINFLFTNFLDEKIGGVIVKS